MYVQVVMLHTVKGTAIFTKLTLPPSELAAPLPSLPLLGPSGQEAWRTREVTLSAVRAVGPGAAEWNAQAARLCRDGLVLRLGEVDAYLLAFSVY